MGIALFRDPWGIPHLRARTADDLAFAQGYAVARDRAWQIELERHRSRGTSAAFLGVDAVDWDVLVRRVRLVDTARRCLHTLDPAARNWVCRFVEGVNAGLPGGADRTPEFAATGLAPGRWQPWTPLAVWLAHHLLFAGFPSKLWRWEVARRLGDEAVGLFAADGPGTSGSNGWLLSGARTATGAALLAGDPHRIIEDPGIYQQVRLSCPEYDVVGLAVPGVPGIAHFGHAGTVAWGITNAMADYQDIYAERLRRRTGVVEALGPDGWRPTDVHMETVEVADDRPVTVEVIETARGPVVVGGPDEQLALSFRHPPRVRGDLGFAALPALLRARTVDDVDRAFDRWVEPVNVVQAADTQGGLLHRVAGVVPLRDPANARRVVPASEPGHEWRGWHTMPRTAVPDLAVMANERGLSAPFGVEFAPPYRAARIRRLLEVSSTWSAPDMARVHTDTELASAKPLLAVLEGLDGLGPAATALRDRLLAWDRRMAADSVEAADFAAVRTGTVRRLAAHPALAPLAASLPYPELFHPWLALAPRIAYALPALLTTDRLPGLDPAAAVRAAVEETAGLDRVRWGERHRLAPWRALPGDQPGPGPELDGDHDCVLATSSVPGVTDVSSRGPAARYVWDLARRDDSRWVVPFGASGVPADPHHHDQQSHWLAGDLIPVLTDWRHLEERHDH